MGGEENIIIFKTMQKGKEYKTEEQYYRENSNSKLNWSQYCAMNKNRNQCGDNCLIFNKCLIKNMRDKIENFWEEEIQKDLDNGQFNLICSNEENFKDYVKNLVNAVRKETIKSMSDGYHTFDELYEHRIRLFISLCRTISKDPQYQTGQKSKIWCSILHSDGTSFEGWFILGIGKEKGKQITYHIPTRFRNEVCEFAQVLNKAPEYDGHTGDDVLKRLKNI
jgi:hypothetical protein